MISVKIQVEITNRFYSESKHKITMVLQKLVSRRDNWCSSAYGTPLVSSLDTYHLTSNIHKGIYIIIYMYIVLYWELRNFCHLRTWHADPDDKGFRDYPYKDNKFKT